MPLAVGVVAVVGSTGLNTFQSKVELGAMAWFLDVQSIVSHN